MTKVAFITGITGQDGSYLAEYLLDIDYIVFGLIRRMSLMNTERIDHILNKITLIYGDITDSPSLYSAFSHIKHIHPNAELEVYHLAAQSHVRISFDMPEYTTNVNAIGTLKLLEECRRFNDKFKSLKVYNAATSELYGKTIDASQNESTPFNPCSPYAIAKLQAFYTAKNYRDAYGLFVSNGILFNHESPRRTANFVTRKITIGLGNIFKNKQSCIELGNLDSFRDWGHAKDYVKAMHLILQYKHPDDFVIATNQTRSVREFIEQAFLCRNMLITWKGTRGSLDEVGIDQFGITRIVINSKFFRPTDVDYLKGDSSKAFALLNWKPTTSFFDLVNEMVDIDCPKFYYISDSDRGTIV